MSVYCVCALSIAADVRRNVELLRSGMCSHVHNRAIHVK